MINKHSIYNWLFFPLLASLLAGSATSCINDPTMEEEDMSGKTTLSITVRGVTTTNGSSDEYIKTLRIIGFDETGTVVCNELHFGTDFDIENDALNITQTMEEAFQGGVCDFYFIANEREYNVYTENNSLTNFLSNVENQTSLEACVISTPSTDQPFMPSEATPILMTTSVRTTLRPGDNTINNIELVRCFAKLQLKIVNKSGEDISVTDPKVNGSYPNSYSLWNGSSSENWNQNDPHYEIDLNPLNQGSVTDDAQNYPLYYSTEVYFPERLFLDANNNNNKDNAITFSFTLNNKTYNVEVADATGTDFNIRRNTHYTVIATLKKKETVTFNILVNAWDGKTMYVPAFE